MAHSETSLALTDRNSRIAELSYRLNKSLHYVETVEPSDERQELITAIRDTQEMFSEIWEA